MGKKYYDSDESSNIGEIIGLIIFIIVLFIFAPWISYWLAYFGGWITSLVVGATLCDALNTLFDTTRFHQICFLRWQELLVGLVASSKV